MIDFDNLLRYYVVGDIQHGIGIACVHPFQIHLHINSCYPTAVEVQPHVRPHRAHVVGTVCITVHKGAVPVVREVFQTETK